MKKGFKSPKIVLDSNVLISALGFPGREMAKLWHLLEERKVHAFISPFILEEVERNLRKKTSLSVDEIQELIADLKGLVHIVTPDEPIDVIKRKTSDNRILECAVKARADALVTGDLRDIRPLDRFRGIEILTPREFLGKYFPPSTEGT